MSAASRDEEVRKVCAELQGKLGELGAIVASLTGILLPPEADPDKERMAT